MAVARTIEDLTAYQLAVTLRDEILRLTTSGPSSRDFDYRDQIRDAARSATRNLAEGFSRFKPREFANLARIALGSLGEVIDQLKDGRKQGYFPEDDAQRLISLAQRAAGATRGLLRYLDSCKGQAPTGWDAASAQSRTKREPKP